MVPELVLIPQDLRTADPSFFAELSAGTMGLAGATASIDAGSPFRVEPPTREWRAALLGFGWLSDLRASNLPDAYALARRTVDDWLAQDRPNEAPDWAHAIAARRLIAWLSNAGMLVEGASPEAYDRFMRGCELHMRRLLALSTHDKDPALLTAHIALVMGCLCLSDQEQRYGPALSALQTGLTRQILPHGGHVSRHPGVPVELMLDLLPLRQCFMAREQKPPAWLADAMHRMVPMLRHLQLGDRGLARFNGMAATEVDRLATVLSYNAGEPAPGLPCAASGYVRLSRRTTAVLLDGGQPPPPEFSAEAHAGALSFEMSAGPHLIVVNAGAPGPAAQAWRRQSRGTPAHSTLLVNDTASARLVKDGSETATARELLTGPSNVEVKYVELGDGAVEVQCVHNGYQHRFAMLHARVLRLSPQGDKLSGIDRVFQSQRGAAASTSRGGHTYSIHFHIHPEARVRYGTEPATAEIELRSGEVWTFSAFGSKLSLEDSLYFASFTGPTRTVQIVLRGHVLADTQIRWTLERKPVEPPKPQLPEPTSH